MEFQAALEDWQDWKLGSDAEQFLFPLYFSGSSENKVAFKDLMVDRLLLLAKAESNETRKNLMYRHAEKLIQNAYTTIPLCVPENCLIISSKISGFTIDHSGEISFRGCR